MGALNRGPAENKSKATGKRKTGDGAKLCVTATWNTYNARKTPARGRGDLNTNKYPAYGDERDTATTPKEQSGRMNESSKPIRKFRDE